MLEPNRPEFPFLALLVSGGHTMLVDVAGVGRYDILGSTLDDAIGEAFDKTAKLLGLEYPGGPAIAKAAELGNRRRFRFPRPMTDRPGLDFSFSGLKTYARNTVAKCDLDHQLVADVAWAFQDAAIDTLVIKCRRALEVTEHDRLVIAGGVGANSELRRRMVDVATTRSISVFYPRPELCTDNGAMIAHAGGLRLKVMAKDNLDFTVRPRWSLADLPAISIP